MRQLAVSLLPLVLVACSAGTGYQFPVGYTPLPVINSVTLHETLEIRAEYGGEYIQNGQVRPYMTISEYYPHCKFELRTPADRVRTVQPETFTVTGIRRDRYMAGYRRLLVAGADGGDYNPVMSTTVISLHSDRQPDVFRLSCSQLDEPYHARHVSLEQMRNTLGDLFTLE